MTTLVSARATKHRAFSFGRVSAIASNTILELVRLKVFYILVLFAMAVIASSLFQAKITFQDQFQILKDVSLGAMSIFTWLLATLSTAMLLPKDIEDRTLYTILAKPVPRFEYLLGKLLGIMVMLLLAIVLMSAMMAVVLYLREAVVLADEAAQTPPDLRAQRLAEVRASAFNPNLIPGVLVVYIKAVVIATVTLLISTFSSSWIFTIFISTAVTLIGHLQGTARQVWMDEQTHSFFTGLFTAGIAILFPDLQVFSLVDDIAVGTAVPVLLFVKAFGLGTTYIVMYFLVAYFSFASREL
jgi:hypothetical protein